jgi:hypothetical protein
MKRKIQLGLAGLTTALISLFMTATAHATDYVGPCSGVPASVGGDIIIADPGSCTIGYDISATGSITISAQGTISAMGISTTGGGNILLSATGNIGTKNLTTSSGTNTGGIEVDANTASAGSLFTIGGTNNANGVNGTINTTSTTGGGTAPAFIHGGLFITNGNAASTAGITVADLTKIQVNASASRSGIIILNAQKGTLTLPTGTLSSVGAAGQGAGSITLLANTIKTANGTIISASQDYTASGTFHNVNIAAQTITVTGASGLQIHADGNGIAGSPGTASAIIAPVGSFTVSSNGDFHNLLWTVSSSNLFLQNLPLTVSGAAPFTVTADGNYGRVSATAHPLTFSNSAVTLQSKAAVTHEVIIGYNGTLNNTLGVGLNGTGTATVDVSAVKRTGDTTATGGNIQVYGDTMTFNSPTLKFSANGVTSGNGDGGTISITSTSAVVKSTSKATISANAASAGTGNGGTITVLPGSANISLGTNAGDASTSATGGSTGGNGGKITVNPTSANIALDGSTATAANVNVLGANGNGGFITLIATDINSKLSNAVIAANAGTGTGTGGSISLNSKTLEFTGTTSTMTANGGATSGNGGTIKIATGSALTVGSGTVGDIAFAANAPLSGNGGTITLAPGFQTNTINTGQLTATAKGQGNGGTISYTGGPLTISGSLNTNGAGNGNGGTLNLTAGFFNFTGTQSFTANSLGSGTGGTVTINSTFTGNTSPLTIGASTTLQAKSMGGAGGTINIEAASQPVSIAGAGITVTAGGNGAGGGINVTASANTITATGTLSVDGSGSGNAGKITLTGGSTGSASMMLDNSTLSASGAISGSGNGNEILISNLGPISLESTTLNAKGGGSGGNAGNITIGTPTGAANSVDISTATINANANASGSGQGGLVTIANPVAEPNTNILSVITVDGGSSNPTTNDGGISLNGKLCNQLTTGLSPFPINYWNCVSPKTGNDQLTANFANTLPSSLQNLLNTQTATNSGGTKAETQMFVFNNGDDYQTFFQFSPAVGNNLAGNTFVVGDPPNRIYTAALENANLPTGYGPLDPESFTEVGAHELGHSIDSAKGIDSQSHSTPYLLDFANDLLYLDYINANQSTPRPPCSNNGTAPFDGVKDATSTNGSLICNATTHMVNPTYAKYTNSLIMQTTQPGLFNKSLGIKPNEETYAQVFSYLAFVSSLTLNPTQAFSIIEETMDGVLAHKVSGQTSRPFFGCSQAWTSSQLLGGPITPPAYCSNTVPSWYMQYQMLP